MNAHTLAQPQPTTTLFQRINRWLFEPNPSVTSAAERRNARLLMYFTAFNLIANILSVALTSIPSFIQSPGETAAQVGLVISLVILGIAVGLYSVSRTSRYRIAGGVLIVFLYLLALSQVTGVTSPSYTESERLIQASIFIVGGVMASIWLGYWLFAAYTVICIITIAATIWGGQTIIDTRKISFALNLLVPHIFLLVFTHHRNKIELDRQAELKSTNAKLTDANKMLRESEALLEQRVIERTRELEVAKERAEQADRVKSQFLASMSHELRTPLNAILSFNKLLAMGTFGEVNEEQISYLNKSMTSGRHLLSLINDVLDITKIQSGMMKLFVEDDFDIPTEMDLIAASAEKLLDNKPVKLIRDIDSTITPLTCDKRRIRQIMLNLISNAVKFTEEGSITLSAKQEGDQILLAVLDTGPGIPEKHQQAIFEPFVQTETGVKHTSGTGLGLPISKSLVEAHGGTIRLESKPDQGAAFYITLPRQTRLALGEQGD